MTPKSKAKKSLNVVSLFTGAGGLDYGFEAAGFRTRVAVDSDADCCRTLTANRSWPVLCTDTANVSADDILDEAGIAAGDVDVLIGGPPCQPFSKAAYWSNGDTKRLSDPRASTLQDYMRFVDELHPCVFLLENVHGIAYSGKEEGFNFLRTEIERINRKHKTEYTFSFAVLDAADFGVPQNRYRFFLVAHRDGKKFCFPKPTHSNHSGPPSLFPEDTLRHATAWDAIGELEDDSNDEDLAVKGRWGNLLPAIPEGENYLWHTARKGGLPLFGWRTAYWSFLLKLAKNRPSWTIQAQPGPAIGPFHWKNRRLSSKELARLQTFPVNVCVQGSRNAVQRQLGNAVPSLLAEVLAIEIASQFYGRKRPAQPELAIPLKDRIPEPERVGDVPPEYLHLLGDHGEHPGTGLGPGAKRREKGRVKN